MKRKIVLVASLAGVFMMTTSSIILFKHSAGIAGYTGSPSETTCSNCHGGGAGTTVVNITGNPAFTANQYVPGQTYTVSIDVTNSNFSNFGFGAEILNGSNTNAGAMTTTLSGVKFIVSGSGRNNATQTTPKSGTGTANFQFVWVAPASGVATIYSAGNAVNNNSNFNGDLGGSASLALSPQIGTGVTEVTKTGFASLSVFPNPTSSSSFGVKYTLIDNGNVRAALYDLNGTDLRNIQ